LHFWPQAWHCGLELLAKNFQIFYYDHENFREQMRNTFSRLGYAEVEIREPDSSDYKFFGRSKAIHKTNKSLLLQQLRDDCNLLNLAFKASVTDYLVFQLSVPKIIPDACNNVCAGKRLEMCDYIKVQ